MKKNKQPQIYTYIEEKPPPDEQLNVIRENLQRDQQREAIRALREEEDVERKRKAAPVKVQHVQHIQHVQHVPAVCK